MPITGCARPPSGRVAGLPEEDAKDSAKRAENRPAAGKGGQMTRILVSDWAKERMKDPAFRREYEILEEEFALLKAIMGARSRAGLTQAQVAKRMKTTQTVIARLE